MENRLEGAKVETEQERAVTGIVQAGEGGLSRAAGEEVRGGWMLGEPQKWRLPVGSL